MSASYNDVTTRVIKSQDFKSWKIVGNVKHIYQGKHLTIKWREVKTRMAIKRIDKDTYAYIHPDGEIEERKYCHNRVRLVESARRSFDNLKQLIRTNFDTGEYSKFITLTYAENMRDRKRLMRDFETFYKRLKRYYYGFTDFAYIAVAEPQGRGAWHIHLMLRDIKRDSLWIEQTKLQEIWGHGRAWIQQLKSDDVGQYYTAYFTALTTTDHEKRCVEDITVIPPKKRVIKASRLKFYDVGMRLYRCSRNIKQPVTAIHDEIHPLDGDTIVHIRAYDIVQCRGSGEATEAMRVNRVAHIDIKPLGNNVLLRRRRRGY